MAKSRIAQPPGTELDLDDPDQQRWAMHDAMDEMEHHHRPKMRPPERSRYWWFWRALGYVLFSPARVFWAWYHRAYYPELRGGNLGRWTYRYPSSKRVKEWIEHGGRFRPLRRFLSWLLLRDWCICPHCGFADYGEDYTIYSEREGEEDREIELFELVEGGGVDYFGEANDCHGWQWCYRCGAVNWETI